MAASLASLMYWLGIGLVGLVIVAGMGAAYYIFGFQIKATEFRLYGGGKKGNYSIAKPKSNRYKWINNRTAWKPLFPLMNKKQVEPFSSEYIYAGNKIYLIRFLNLITPP